MEYERGDTIPHPDMEIVVKKISSNLENVLAYKEYNDLHKNTHYWLGKRIAELVREYICDVDGYKTTDFIAGIESALLDIYEPEPIMPENEVFNEYDPKN